MCHGKGFEVERQRMKGGQRGTCKKQDEEERMKGGQRRTCKKQDEEERMNVGQSTEVAFWQSKCIVDIN